MEKYQFAFGCMRLPLLNADDVASFDFAKTEQLFDAYLNFGFTYFDTAYLSWLPVRKSRPQSAG